MVILLLSVGVAFSTIAGGAEALVPGTTTTIVAKSNSYAPVSGAATTIAEAIISSSAPSVSVGVLLLQLMLSFLALILYCCNNQFSHSRSITSIDQ